MAEPSIRDISLLADIVLSARDAQDFVAGMSFKTFQASRLHQNAVIRLLEVIGEAASKISPTLREEVRSIFWPNVINMRHRLIHD